MTLNESPPHTPSNNPHHTPTPRTTHPAPRPPWWAANTRQPLLHPHQVRTRTLRGTLGILAFITATILGGWWVLTSTEVKYIEVGPRGEHGIRQTTNALVGGCGRMYTFPGATAKSGTVPTHNSSGIPNRQDYPTIVPMFGRFWNDPAPADQTFWSRDEADIPEPENLLRNQWDGQMVVYYTTDVTEDDLDRLTNLLLTEPELDMLVVPWPNERGPLPAHRNFAFVTWNHSQTCHRLELSALHDFRRFYPPDTAPGNDGTPPPDLTRSTR